jgi:polyvinyl alcohol dehydrogenase (cytochrome)
VTAAARAALAAACMLPAISFARPAVAIAPASPASPVPVAPGRLGHDWPKYCADLEMTGNARGETRISPASARSLRLAWKISLPGVIASSPTVVSGRVYVGDWSGIEWALDAANGQAIAFADLGTTVASECLGAVSKGITSAPAFSHGKLFLAGGDDSFYALDPETLEVSWKTSLGDNTASGGYYGWSSPAPVAGRIYQGVASNCDNPFVDGQVVALDAVSGSILSLADLSETSEPSRFGAGVWTSPAVDLGAGDVFVTTASAYHYEDGLAYSVARLSLANLSVKDSWKITPAEYAETEDADWGSSPTLFFDGNGRLLVGASQKNGQYYAFQRANLAGGPVWKTPLAAGGGCAQCGEGSISTAAFDGARLYVGGGRVSSFPFADPGSVSALDPATGGRIWRYSKLDGPVLAPVAFANGVVFATAGTSCVALDAASGRLLWKVRTPAPMYGGVAVSDGRVFFGDTSGNLYAYEVP